MVVGVGADHLGPLREADTAVAENGVKISEGSEGAVGQRLIGEGPQTLGRLEFRGVGGQGHQFNPLGDTEVRAGMPARLVEGKQDVLIRTGSDLAGKVGEREIEGGGADGGQEEPVGPPTGRMEEGVHVQPLIALADHGEGAAAFGSPDAAQDRFEPDPVLVRGPDFNRPLRHGSSPRRYERREVCLKAACAAGSARSCRGRGTRELWPKRCK
jgi:hypothetical protein